VKALLLRQIPLSEASERDIAGDFLGWRDLDLPLDESTVAAKHYVAVTAADVEAVVNKWLRPDQMVRVTQGPPPG
jgi:zinc protease